MERLSRFNFWSERVEPKSSYSAQAILAKDEKTGYQFGREYNPCGGGSCNCGGGCNIECGAG